MTNLNPAAIPVAAVVVFVVAGVYYSALAGEGAKLGAAWARRSRPPAWLMGLELVKSVVVAGAIAALVSLIGITAPLSAIGLGLGLWITFPVVLLVGSVTQEGVPWALAAIHGGDWLAKLVIIALIVSVWR